MVALAMGATIQVMEGYRVDRILSRANPFAAFAGNIFEGRKAASASGDGMLELVYKLLGNTLYGKISQGVASKRPIADDVEDHRIFDAETGEMADLPPCSITCPPIAAWATSFVRATMFEALYRLPSTAIALQATTDGILFVGNESDIDTSGPIAQAFKCARSLVTGATDPRIWELKHRIPRVITFKTRGMISVVPVDWAQKIHIAKLALGFPITSRQMLRAHDMLNGFTESANTTRRSNESNLPRSVSNIGRIAISPLRSSMSTSIGISILRMSPSSLSLMSMASSHSTRDHGQALKISTSAGRASMIGGAVSSAYSKQRAITPIWWNGLLLARCAKRCEPIRAACCPI